MQMFLNGNIYFICQNKEQTFPKYIILPGGKKIVALYFCLYFVLFEQNASQEDNILKVPQALEVFCLIRVT